ncbi:DUF2637 domain-containing protein [Streptomyces sp. 030-HV]|uniref:DUF2637 domain-containing protein n=1 Tax=Streptomyces sp. 030-HV TaxID=2789262 RepID=UPI0039810237
MSLATLHRAPAPAGPVPDAPDTAPDAQALASDAAPSVPETDAPASAPAGRRSDRALTAIAIVGGTILAAIGFTGSYNTLRDLAFDRGFGDFSYVFPVGIDAGIVVLYALDLYLIRRHTPWPIVRTVAHLLTVATVVFNAAAAEGGVTGDPLGTAMHGVIPLLFIVAVEAARRAFVKASDTRDSQGVPLARWLLSPGRTAALWRRMKLWGTGSYQETVQIEQERTVYEAMLQRQYGKAWRKKAPADALLPLTMARYGLTVDEALALPRQAKEAEQLRAEENERLELEAAARAEQRAAERRMASIRTNSDIRAAEIAAQADENAAVAQAQATVTEAQAAAEAQARIAQKAAQAIESADAAEADRRAAEAEKAAAEARARAAEVTRAAAEVEAAAAEAADRKAAADRRRALLEKQAADDEQYAAELKRHAAEARAAAAEAEARAVEAEDLLKLTPRERAVRKVARTVLAHHAGQTDQLPIASIADAFGVSESTASEYRKEAAALIAGGYRNH